MGVQAFHLPVRRRTRTPLITVAQFAELMAAISALPDRIADELERRGNVPPRIDPLDGLGDSLIDLWSRIATPVMFAVWSIGCFALGRLL